MTGPDLLHLILKALLCSPSALAFNNRNPNLLAQHDVCVSFFKPPAHDFLHIFPPEIALFPVYKYDVHHKVLCIFDLARSFLPSS